MQNESQNQSLRLLQHCAFVGEEASTPQTCTWRCGKSGTGGKQIKAKVVVPLLKSLNASLVGVSYPGWLSSSRLQAGPVLAGGAAAL